jgi:alkylated DNA repair dioxygenase AlkB
MLRTGLGRRPFSIAAIEFDSVPLYAMAQIGLRQWRFSYAQWSHSGHFEALSQRRVMLLKPKGLQYLERWISEDEHGCLLAAIDVEPWLTDISRRVQHYGFRYNYETRKVDPGMFLDPLPDWSLPIANRLHVKGLMRRPDQLIINEYLPGQGIAPHTDCIPCFGPAIASLSLGTAVVMDLLRGDDRVSILLRPCSLLVLADDARSEWRHGIVARKSDTWEGERTPRGRRVSMTFRTVRR